MRTFCAIAGFALALLVLWVAAIAVNSRSYADYPARRAPKIVNIDPTLPQKPEEVAFFALAANPDAYDGRYVRVSGYLDLAFEGTALYRGRTELEHPTFGDGVWVNIGGAPALRSTRAKARFTRQYVTIDGVFARGKDFSPIYVGELERIIRIAVLPSRAEYAWQTPLLQVSIVPMLMVAVFTAGVGYFAFGLHRRR